MSLIQPVLQTVAAVFGLFAFVVGVVRIEPFFGPVLWFYVHCLGSQRAKFVQKRGFVPLGGDRQVRFVAVLTNKLERTRLYAIRKRKPGDSLEELQARRQRSIAFICILISTGFAIAAFWTA